MKKDNSQKSLDDFYALIFARPISKRISRAIINSRITPNMVSVIGVILGIFSSILILYNAPFMAGIALYISFVADCVDGELARSRKQFTKTGFWLESSLDTISLLFPIIALGIVTSSYGTLCVASISLLLTRVRMLASDITSLKFNLNLKKHIITSKTKRILWQLRYGNSLQYVILIVGVITTKYSLTLIITGVVAGIYYLASTLYEIKFYYQLNKSDNK